MRSHYHEELMGRNSLCLLGGTFDRFHVGHEQLLRVCLEQSDEVQVWLICDEMARKKDSRVLSWDERSNQISAWAEGAGLSGRLSIHLLEDKVGPAPTSNDADAIGCTKETRPTCEVINSKRQHVDLPPLAIIEVDHVLDMDGEIVSSRRIRAGEIGRDGISWLGDAEMQIDQRMPVILDDELKHPFGTLHEGSESNLSEAMRKALATIVDESPKLIAVGDVCVHTLVDMGQIPDVAFVDGMTKREAWAPAADLDRTVFRSLLTCTSPPGVITAELKQVTSAALSNSEPTLVVVNGEEDLAPLIVHLIAPLGCAVVYGQPGKGVVLRRTTEETKENCRRLLDVFTREV